MEAKQANANQVGREANLVNNDDLLRVSLEETPLVVEPSEGSHLIVGTEMVVYQDNYNDKKDEEDVIDEVELFTSYSKAFPIDPLVSNKSFYILLVAFLIFRRKKSYKPWRGLVTGD